VAGYNTGWGPLPAVYSHGGYVNPVTTTTEQSYNPYAGNYTRHQHQDFGDYQSTYFNSAGKIEVSSVLAANRQFNESYYSY